MVKVKLMADHIVLNDRPLLKKIIQTVGPCKKLCHLAYPTLKVTLSNTYWTKGNRSSYFMVDMRHWTMVPLGHFESPDKGGPKKDLEQVLYPDFAIVEAGIQAMRPKIPTIYLNPTDYANMKDW